MFNYNLKTGIFIFKQKRLKIPITKILRYKIFSMQVTKIL